MADWSGAWNSNWFKVRDAQKFREEFITPLYYFIDCQEHKNHPGYFRIWSDPEGDGNFPTQFGESDENFELDDMLDKLYPHLEDHEVAIIMQAGHESVFYISGLAVAVNYAGLRKEINLWDIVDLAKTLTAFPERVTKPTHYVALNK